MDKEKVLISFSGGRTSAYMTWWMLQEFRDQYEMIVVLANTGKEREETLGFIKRCDDQLGFGTIWVECVTNPVNRKGVAAKVVDFDTADRSGAVFEAMIAKHGLPSVKSPHCTREMKKRTIRAYARSIGWKDYRTAIGIRSDEMDRISSVAKEERLFYPFCSSGKYVTKLDVNEFWSKQAFDLELKSYEGNCDLCFKKSLRKLITIIREHPELTQWYRDIEDKYAMFVPKGKVNLKPPVHMFREGRTIYDLIAIEEKLRDDPDFEIARDESKDLPEFREPAFVSKNPEVLQLMMELDLSNGCSESCEVF